VGGAAATRSAPSPGRASPPRRWSEYAASPRVTLVVAEIATTADEQKWREHIVALVYDVIEHEFTTMGAKEGWRFAEWLLGEHAKASPEPEAAERLRDAAEFVRWMRLDVAKYAPPNPPRRARTHAPRSLRPVTVEPVDEARRSPRAREWSPQP
jgi:hypothetical protein